MMKNKLLLAAVMVCCFVAGFAQAPREITERFDVYKAQVIRRVAYVDMVQLKFVPLAPKANKKLFKIDDPAQCGSDESTVDGSYKMFAY
ncbi:MAG: hypothetical protein EOO07_33525 [Chitinophagaceae bacterium]|nr:MAG: hypothetical protein EOO07_33525 [Chitinophagaceae bacterium]